MNEDVYNAVPHIFMVNCGTFVKQTVDTFFLCFVLSRYLVVCLFVAFFFFFFWGGKCIVVRLHYTFAHCVCGCGVWGWG